LGVALSSDGRLASAARDGRICLRQLGDSSAGDWLDGHQGWVTSVRFAASGKSLLTGGFDGTVRVWDVATTSESFSLAGHILWINAVALPPERSGMYALSAGNEGTVLLWNLDRRAQVGSFGEPFKWHIASCLDVSPDGKRIAVAGWAPSVRVFDASSHELIHDLPIAVSPILSICFDSSGERLVAAAASGVIHVWNVVTGAELDTFVAHRGAARSLAAFEAIIASTGDDGMVRQWSV
jgi:WD40 repeat protein